MNSHVVLSALARSGLIGQKDLRRNVAQWKELHDVLVKMAREDLGIAAWPARLVEVISPRRFRKWMK